MALIAVTPEKHNVLNMQQQGISEIDTAAEEHLRLAHAGEVFGLVITVNGKASSDAALDDLGAVGACRSQARRTPSAMKGTSHEVAVGIRPPS